MDNILLKKDTFIFKNILANGYKINENVSRILDKKIMADGSTRINYGVGSDTTIEVNFGQLTNDEVKLYLNKFGTTEVELFYYSVLDNRMKKGLFLVTELPQEIITKNNKVLRIEEFTVKLELLKSLPM